MQISHTFYKQDDLNYDMKTCKVAIAENQERRLDVITIVAMFTIVTINHSRHNTNHNCRKKPQLSQCQPQLSQSCSTTIVATPITNVAIFSKFYIFFFDINLV